MSGFPKCLTCTHWKPDQTSYPASAPYGRCAGILTDHNGNTGLPAVLTTLPYMGADLDTLPSFGCALHSNLNEAK